MILDLSKLLSFESMLQLGEVSIMARSTAFTATKSDRLPIFLELCDQLVSLSNDIYVLFVFVVRSVGFDDSIDSIYRARYPICGDEFCKIAVESQLLLS